MSFPANYDGDCANCPERIREGEEIIMVNNLAQHADCPMAHVEQRGEACPVCFLIHPAGSCDRQ